MSGVSDLAGCGDQDRRGRESGKHPGDRPGDPDYPDLRVRPENRQSQCPYCDGPGRERILQLQNDTTDPEEASRRATDLAWAAGLFDGEGNVWIGESGQVQLKVDMMSAGPVQKLGSLLGGRVGVWNHKNGHVVWRWRVSGTEDVLRIVDELEPHCLEKGYELLLGMAVLKKSMTATDARALVIRHREGKKNG